MDRWDSFRRPTRDSISEPVYSTPNPPSSPLSTRSPQSSTAKSVSFADLPSTSVVITPPSTLNVNLLNDPNHMANLLAVLENPTVISQRLTKLQKDEEDLETQLAEIECKRKDIRKQRSQLIEKLVKIISSQSSVSPNPAKSPLSPSPFARSAETIIEQLDPEPLSQPRSPNANSSTFKKRPGPASKTGLKTINPGSLPPLGPISGSSKNTQKDDSLKRPVTTGVKQSRPQQIRARKRNKDNGTESSTLPKSSIPVRDQTANEIQPNSQVPVQFQSPPQPQTQSKVQPPSCSTQPLKQSQTPSRSATQHPANSIAKEKIKTEPKTEEKSRISVNSQNNDTQSPFRNRSDTGSSSNNEPIKKKIKQEPESKPKKPEGNVTVCRDDDTDPLRPEPVQTGSDDDSAHSDSHIFDVLRNVQANGESPDISIRKVKKESQTAPPVSVKVATQDASRREPKIKQEK